MDKGVAGYDPSTKASSTDTSSTWKATEAAVSVGDASKGITRQITGVAAGAADTDAVNVAQLKKVEAKAEAAEKKHTTVKAGGRHQCRRRERIHCQRTQDGIYGRDSKDYG